MKNKNSFILVLKKAAIVCLFILALLIFCTCEIFLLHVKVPWQVGLLKLFSCASQIAFSILGVSFLMEYSTLRKVSKDSMEEMKTSIVNHISQIDYIKKNYSEEQKRELLLMSYMKNGSDNFGIINNSDKSSLLSFEKIIEELISCIYYDKDDTTVVYEFFDNYISKKVNRKITVKNLYNSDTPFVARSSFNNFEVNGKNVKAFRLTKLIINGDEIDRKNFSKYLKDGEPTSKDTTYTQHKTIVIPTNCSKETYIDYSIELKLPKNDMQSLITTTFPVKDFTHTIILKKGKKLKDADINVFSLAKAMKVKNERFESKTTSDDDTMKVFNIESSTWLFPGDGYTILLK